tara:strand:- start:398 stop:616 length:219 start_codon:yes stop_codon:yes gene_type:complete
MKIVLSLIICSALAGECQPPFSHKNLFEDWSSCMYQGYNNSLQLLGVMGDDYINKNLIFIKFACREVPDKTT